jgi:hypothetical protein
MSKGALLSIAFEDSGRGFDNDYPGTCISSWVRKLDCNEDLTTSVPLLPTLQHLAFNIKTSRFLGSATLVDVVRSRWQPFNDSSHGLQPFLRSSFQTKVERSIIESLCKMCGVENYCTGS